MGERLPPLDLRHTTSALALSFPIWKGNSPLSPMAAWVLRPSYFLGTGMNSSPSHWRAMALLGLSSPAFPWQGDRCIMGQQRSFRKRKSTSWCIKGRSFTSALESRVCRCRESDFLW